MSVSRYFLILLVILVGYGCQGVVDRKNYEVIRNVRGKEIKISNVELFFSYNSKILIYVDTVDCTTCRVRNLIFWQDLMEDYQELDSALNLIYVINPRPEVEVEVEAILYELGLKNVWLDRDNDFIKMNPFVPRDKKFHVFLLNKENKIELIGSPIGNKKLDKLYRKVIKNLKCI